jgi:hypothetical protein
MVPDVAESMTCRQLPDQFHLRSGDESGDQSEHAIESLHRTALDAQRDCAEAEQDARRVDVRAGAQHPPGSGIGDDENGFAHHRTRDGRWPDRVAWIGRASNAGADRRTNHVADERHQDASDAIPIAVCQCDAQQRQVPRHRVGEHVAAARYPIASVAAAIT